MKRLLIEQTYKMPKVNFDPYNGILEIQGKSIPEYASNFYRPVLDWLDQYCQKPHATTNMRILFYYYNTDSAKCILDIFKKLDELFKKGYEVKIEWLYEKGDTSSVEDAEYFSQFLSVPFEIVMVED